MQDDGGGGGGGGGGGAGAGAGREKDALVSMALGNDKVWSQMGRSPIITYQVTIYKLLKMPRVCLLISEIGIIVLTLMACLVNRSKDLIDDPVHNSASNEWEVLLLYLQSGTIHLQSSV